MSTDKFDNVYNCSIWKNVLILRQHYSFHTPNTFPLQTAALQIITEEQKVIRFGIHNVFGFVISLKVQLHSYFFFVNIVCFVSYYVMLGKNTTSSK